MIEVTFTLTLAEYLEAQEIFMREQNRKARWWRIPAYCVLGVGFIIVLVNAPKPYSFNTLPPAALIFLVLLTVPVWLKPLQRMNFKKRFLLEKQNLTNVAVSVDIHGYHVNVPGVGAGVADWGGMTSWHEGKTVFVMKSGLLMRLLPKSAFDSSQLTEIRSLLTREIGPENIARRIAVN